MCTTFDAKALEKIRRVSLARGTDSTRFTLQGVYLHPVGSQFHAVATSGKVIAIAAVQSREPIADNIPGVVLPPELLRELSRSYGPKGLKRARWGLRLELEGTVCRLAWIDGAVQVQAMDGPYPDYRCILPQKPIVAYKAPQSFNPDLLSVALDILETTKTTSIFGHETGKPDTPAWAANDLILVGVMPLVSNDGGKYLTTILGAANGMAAVLRGETTETTAA